MTSLHERLKRTRKSQGLSQHQLAEMCDVSQPTIANWERGGHTPRENALIRLAKSLNVDRYWLLSGRTICQKAPRSNTPRSPHTAYSCLCMG